VWRCKTQDATKAIQEPPAGAIEKSSRVEAEVGGRSEDLRWRTLLCGCRAAKHAAYLGPTHAARAAVEVVREADATIRTKVKAILASQAAKNEFLTDLAAFDRFLREHDEFLREMVGRRHRPRRRSRLFRQEPLPVDAARAVPLPELLERYGVDLRTRGARLVGHCPFHDDARPSLEVNTHKGLWHCFPCGIGGDGIAFVMQLKALGFAEAVREVVG
jgi:hypothetical protein